MLLNKYLFRDGNRVCSKLEKITVQRGLVLSLIATVIDSLLGCGYHRSTRPCDKHPNKDYTKYNGQNQKGHHLNYQSMLEPLVYLDI